MNNEITVRATPQIKNLPVQLPERGKIKIGKKGEPRKTRDGKGEYQIPIKLDHFVVTTLDRDTSNNFVKDEAVHRMLRDATPKSLPVRLLFNDIGMSLATRYGCFVGKTLWCAGDGETASRLTRDGVTRAPVACPCERIQVGYKGQDKCRFNGQLSVLIDGVPGVGGVWKFRTTAYNSVIALTSSMALIKSLTGGVLANIPLNMVLRPKSVQSPDGNGQQTIYVVSLEYAGTIDELREIGLGAHRQALEHRISVQGLEQELKRTLALPATDTNSVFDGEDPEDIASEFWPPADDAPPGMVEDKQPPIVDPLLADASPGSPAKTASKPRAQTAPEKPGDDSWYEMDDVNIVNRRDGSVLDSPAAGADPQLWARDVGKIMAELASADRIDEFRGLWSALSAYVDKLIAKGDEGALQALRDFCNGVLENPNPAHRLL